MNQKDFYNILGVDPKASKDEIRKAYRKLAQKHHPDRNKGLKSAEEKFKDITEAYQVLADEKKRSEYDLIRQYGFPGQGTGGGVPPGWTGGRPGGPRVYNWNSADPGGMPVDFSEIFGGGRGQRVGGRGGIGDIFSEIFGGGGADFSASGGRPPTEDTEAEMTIEFMDAVNGATKTFQLARERACPSCNGSGARRTEVCKTCGGSGRRKAAANSPIPFAQPCPTCRGAGQVTAESCPSCRGMGRTNAPETITVKIPAGARDGGRLRIPGKGQTGQHLRSGDLYIRLQVKPHRYFRREGDDIHLDLPVTISEAALGTSIEVPTIDGRSTLKIPAGTQGGQTLRLKGKGVAQPKTGARGDQYVHINVVVPKKLNKKTKELLEELKSLDTENPRQNF